MASRLLYIKTVSLLPRHEEIQRLKEELTGELIEYMVCRQIAAQLSTMQSGFDKFVRKPAELDLTIPTSLPTRQMLCIFRILRR